MNADLEKLQESNKTELERRGSIFNIGAPATEAVTIRDQIAVGFGDGTVRFFQSGSDPKTVKAHKGVVLSMTNYEDHVLTGGDDGRFLKISSDGNIVGVSYNKTWVMDVNNNYRVMKTGEIPLVKSGISKVLEHSNPNFDDHKKDNLKLLTIGSAVGSTNSIVMIEKDKFLNMNVATSENYTVDKIAKIALKACDVENMKIKYDKEMPNGQLRKDIDITKLKQNFPEHNPISLFDGIKEIFEKKYQNG